MNENEPRFTVEFTDGETRLWTRTQLDGYIEECGDAFISGINGQPMVGNRAKLITRIKLISRLRRFVDAPSTTVADARFALELALALEEGDVTAVDPASILLWGF